MRKLRRERGLTQARLAVQAGLDPSSLSQIETGARRPNTRTLEKLAGVLGVEVRDLFPLGQAPLPLEEDGRSSAPEVLGERIDEIATMSREEFGRFAEDLGTAELLELAQALDQEYRARFAELKRATETGQRLPAGTLQGTDHVGTLFMIAALQLQVTATREAEAMREELEALAG